MATSTAEIWQALELSLDAKGRPYPNVHNAYIVLRKSPVWKDRFYFDEFHLRIRFVGNPHPRNMEDSDEVEFLMFMQNVMEIPRMPISAARLAFVRAAAAVRRNELREWLEGLKWDGEKRLAAVMQTGFGAEPSDFSEAVGLILFKSLAARATLPGCKCDTMIVLEGRQGTYKSSALEAIGGKWYGALHSAFGDKDSYLEMQGKWLIEVPELASFSKRGEEINKKFLSKRMDTFRPPYGRHAIDAPRQCVFIGSTNEDAYLHDATGARRFLPVRCGNINLGWLKEHREQLFAEALSRVRGGEEWWLLDDGEARAEQDRRYQDDPWHEPVRTFLLDKQSTTVAEVLKEACKLDISRQGKPEEMRVANILSRAGWIRRQVGPQRRRVWCHPDADAAQVAQVVPIKVAKKQPAEPPEQAEQPNTRKTKDG